VISTKLDLHIIRSDEMLSEVVFHYDAVCVLFSILRLIK